MIDNPEQVANKITQLKKISIIAVFVFVISGFLIPETVVIPVQSATSKDWNGQTFWYEPWGKSGVHKGIDIFAPKGQPIVSASKGMVLYSGEISLGGKVLLILGSKWRLHYYAHLEQSNVNRWMLLSSGDEIGSVGDSGNAKGKQAHLHYSVVTLIPYIWKIDRSTQGWKKMFYLDPSQLLMK